jgi:hypothetical protein
VGAGAGVNLFAGGAIEVLCSSQAYRHAAYRRVRRDGALGVGLRGEGYVGRELRLFAVFNFVACLGVSLTRALDLRWMIGKRFGCSAWNCSEAHKYDPTFESDKISA